MVVTAAATAAAGCPVTAGLEGSERRRAHTRPGLPCERREEQRRGFQQKGDRLPCERRATGNGQRDSRGGLPEQTGVEGRPPTTATSVNRAPCANRVEGFMALSIRDREEGSKSLTALSWLVPSHIPVNAGLEGRKARPGANRQGLPCERRAGRCAWKREMGLCLVAL